MKLNEFHESMAWKLERPCEQHGMLQTLRLLLTMVNFYSWKWACKMRDWRLRLTPSVFSARQDSDWDRDPIQILLRPRHCKEHLKCVSTLRLRPRLHMCFILSMICHHIETLFADSKKVHFWPTLYTNYTVFNGKLSIAMPPLEGAF